MSCRVLIHALFNCLADCYDAEALKAVVDCIQLKSPVRDDDKVARLNSISRIIGEACQTDRFWQLFSALFPLRLQRWEALRLALQSSPGVVITLTPDLTQSPSGMSARGTKVTTYRQTKDWPPEDKLDHILDECILHSVVLGASDVGVNRDDGPQWVRTACCRYRDLPVAFWVPHGEKWIWQERLSKYGIRVPDSAQEYLGNPFDLDGTVAEQINSRCENIQKRLAQPFPSGRIFILHISDIHLGARGDAKEEARHHCNALIQDLRNELRIPRLDYVVVSGDIASHAKAEEYAAAQGLLRDLLRSFDMDVKHLILVPGNHDVDYQVSKDAASPIKHRSIPKPLEDIPKAEPELDFQYNGKWYRFNKEMYQKRFDNFSRHLYEPLFGRSYPTEYHEQVQTLSFPEDHLLFVGLNSAWSIDRYNEKRAAIHSEAAVIEKGEDDNLRILVGHHPFTDMGQDDLLDNLVAKGFSIYLHGHLHEAGHGLHPYDGNRKIHMVRAGTFGAKSKDRRESVPLQYNLIVLDRDTGTALVESRRRETSLGPWSADARWGPDKNAPIPRYVIKLNWEKKSSSRVPAVHAPADCDRSNRMGMINEIGEVIA